MTTAATGVVDRHRHRRLAAVSLTTAVLLSAGCVHYPTVEELGGIQFKAENARAVRKAGAAECYLDLNSTGKYPDVLRGAVSAVAKRAVIIGPGDQPVERLDILPQTRFPFSPGGYRVVLTELTHPLQPGEIIIITLMFERYGAFGIITVVQ